MKIWIQRVQEDGVKHSFIWNVEKPLLLEGSRRFVLDYKPDDLSHNLTLMELDQNHKFKIQTLKNSVTELDQHEYFNVFGMKWSFSKIPNSHPISEEEIRFYQGQIISIPSLTLVNTDEIQFKKIQKTVYSTGAIAVLVLLIGTTIFQKYYHSEVPLVDPSPVTVKLDKMPSPSVISSAYERAMKQGAQQSQKLDARQAKAKAPAPSGAQSIKNAFASLLGGGLSLPKNQGPTARVGAEAAGILLPKVSGDGHLGRKGQGDGASGDSLVKVAYTGASGEGYQAGGEIGAVGSDGLSGQGDGWLSLNLSEALVEEGLSRDEVGRVIHAQISEIRYCYESSMLHKPDIEGKLTIDFTIASSGRVRTANVKESSVRDERLNECILKRLARWEFPKPKSGVEVAVSYPFIFKRLRR